MLGVAWSEPFSAGGMLFLETLMHDGIVGGSGLPVGKCPGRKLLTLSLIQTVLQPPELDEACCLSLPL